MHRRKHRFHGQSHLAGARSRRIGTHTLMGGSLSDLNPELSVYARALVNAAGVAGLQPRITSTMRTHSEQGRLYRSFLANPARAYPVATACQSAHEYGEAFDLVLTPMTATADFRY